MCGPSTGARRHAQGYVHAMSDNPITSTRQGDVLVIRMDDGKANALSNASIDALNAALDEAERDAGAVVLVGRPGRFCAGFDLSVINAGLAQSKNRSGLGWWIASLFFGPVCTVLIVLLDRLPPGPMHQ